MTDRKPTQAERLLVWLRQNPGSSGMDIIVALRIPKYTSRISDLREAGHRIDCWTDKDGTARYTLKEPSLTQTALFFADEGVGLHRHEASSVPRNTHPSLGHRSLTKAGA